MLSLVERLAAITAQIGLSVIVWYAAAGKKMKGYLLVLAILLHAILDRVAVLTAKSGMSLIVVEVFVWLIAIGIVWTFYKMHQLNFLMYIVRLERLKKN